MIDNNEKFRNLMWELTGTHVGMDAVPIALDQLLTQAIFQVQFLKRRAEFRTPDKALRLISQITDLIDEYQGRENDDEFEQD